MSEIYLFKQEKTAVVELKSSTVLIERELQTLIETYMENFFSTRLVASEYAFEGGRMDSLGLDENNCPVIFEYKRYSNENVINQGLFYMDWLITHKDSFYVLVMKKLGKEIAELIDWSVPRLCCIANDFTKYDEHAINQMSTSISLYRYKKYNDNLLLLELLSAYVEKKSSPKIKINPSVKKSNRIDYEDVRDFILSLGDDVTENPLKLYVAFNKRKNFICVVMQKTQIILLLSLDPSSVVYEPGFSRDVTNIGHWGTGNVELMITSAADLEKSKPLLIRAYQENLA
jgi:predicted transport protein